MLISDMNDFLSQLPPGLLLTFCGVWLLMLVSLALLLRSGVRKRRAARQTRPQPGTIPVIPAEPAAAHDLPDLDLLVGTEPSPGIPMPGAAAVAPPKRAAGTYTLRLENGRQVDAVDVLTVSRDLADGGLIVQIGDRAYGHAADISDAEARRRLKGVLRELAQQITSEPQAPAPANQTPSPAPPPAPGAPVQAPTPPPASDASWNLPDFNAMVSEPLKLRGGKPKQAVPEINIAGAIEAYLQHKIRVTPGFEGRRLHIHNAPGGGVRIEVDGQFYEAVSDIEDMSTREFIAAAIAEWQASQ